MTKVRKAVGAVIKFRNRFLLIHKVRIKDLKNGAENILGEWDFPKGGAKDLENLKNAVIRELKEETGSDRYKIIKEFDNKISFEFPEPIKKKIGFDMQETTMFLIDYLGDCSDLKPQDDEIDNICFFDSEEVLNKLTHKESKEFFIKNLFAKSP
jgi:putative (di)nucleoside polyphosphate hydrolase